MEHSLRKRQTIFVNKRGEKPLGTPANVKITQQFSARGDAPSHRRRASMLAPGGAAGSGRPRSASGLRQLAGSIPEDAVVDAPKSSGNDGADSLLANVDPALVHSKVDSTSYIAANLSSASPQEIDAFAEQLRSQLEQIERDEQDSIRRNYEALLTVSRDVSELAPQVSELRKLVADLHTVTDALKQDAEAHTGANGLHRSMSQLSIASDGPGASLNRNSMLMLNNVWAQDLMALFRRVEGAQKFLPAMPGRHVVMESGSWYELNPVTWQPTKPITLFLINDHLLVATKRKTKGGTGSSSGSSSRVLTVDQCWPLQDVTLEDLSKAESAAGHTVQIQAPSTGFFGIYSSNSSKALRVFVGEFRKAQHALQETSNNQSSSKHHKRQVSKASIRSQEVSVDERREALKIMADIDLRIAKHQYQEAADLCFQNKDNDLVSKQVIEREKSLVEVLLSLLRTATTKEESVRVVELLSQMNQAREARTALLASRTSLLDSRVKKIHFRGDIVKYVSQMAVTYFQLIKATVEIYRRAFPARQDSSIIVEWVKYRVDAYAEFFNRQLYKIGQQTSVYKQCVEITKQESSQLQLLGLNMDFLLSYVWGEP